MVRHWIIYNYLPHLPKQKGLAQSKHPNSTKKIKKRLHNQRAYMEFACG